MSVMLGIMSRGIDSAALSAATDRTLCDTSIALMSQSLIPNIMDIDRKVSVISNLLVQFGCSFLTFMFI